MRHGRTRETGYTLVELLTVVTIIGLLAAILLPVVTKVRENARQTTCLSNMRQIGLALTMYCQDHDETYPRQDYCYGDGTKPLPGAPASAVGCNGPGPYGSRVNHYKWWFWVYPYVKNTDVFRCPSRDILESAWVSNAQINNAYALNTSVTGTLNVYKVPNGTVRRYRDSFLGGTLAGIDDSANLIMIGEHWQLFLWEYDCGDGDHSLAYPLATREIWEQALKPGGIVDKRAAPHNGGFSIAYADGHARWMSVDRFLEDCPGFADYAGSETGPKTVPTGIGWALPVVPTVTKEWPLWGLKPR